MQGYYSVETEVLDDPLVQRKNNKLHGPIIGIPSRTIWNEPLALFYFFHSFLLRPNFGSPMMEGHPVFLRPEGTLRIITLGGSGGIHQDPNDQILKVPLKYNTQGCNPEVIASVASREEFSKDCIVREKLVYQALPKDDPNILKCLSIAKRGIQFPYLQHRDVRTYLQNHEIDLETQGRWIQNAVDAIATIHACGIVHSDISPRNFLVTDDLSIQLCDFAGSRISDLHSLVEEETRYRLPLSPSSPRTAIADLFALGSFIYEISTGTSPFPDLDDDEIERRYASLDFPSLDGLKYHKVISKCWKSQYSSADMVRGDIRIEDSQYIYLSS